MKFAYLQSLVLILITKQTFGSSSRNRNWGQSIVELISSFQLVLASYFRIQHDE